MAIRDFVNDKRGTTFEGIALSVSLVAVAFVASADMLDYMTKSHNKTGIMTKLPTMAAGTNLDYTPTGALPKLISRSVLDPCTGEVR